MSALQSIGKARVDGRHDHVIKHESRHVQGGSVQKLLCRMRVSLVYFGRPEFFGENATRTRCVNTLADLEPPKGSVSGPD